MDADLRSWTKGFEQKSAKGAKVRNRAIAASQLLSQSLCVVRVQSNLSSETKRNAKTMWHTWHTTRKELTSPGFSGGYVVCQLAHHGTPRMAQHARGPEVRFQKSEVGEISEFEIIVAEMADIIKMSENK